MINASIFKSYDIRGIYPEEMEEEVVYNIGRAFVGLTKAKSVVVGRDMRISSPTLHKALISGITSQGANVFDLGEVISELVYFTVASKNYDSGIMITASHNPKEYNGFKMLKKNGQGFDMVKGMDLLKPVQKAKFKDAKKPGRIEQVDVWQDYINHCLSMVEIDKIKPFKIVVDAGNGMASKSIPKIEKSLPIKIVPLNFQLDGNFPNHPSNFLLEGATNQISQKVKEEKANFGIIFDGDADRVGLLDENGQYVEGDVSLMIMAKYFLSRRPGLAIVYNSVSSKAVAEKIGEWGGKAIKAPVGFVNMRERLMANKGFFSGERPSSHFAFKDNFYGDSGILAFLSLLVGISVYNKKVSEIYKELYPYFRIAEMNFVTDKKQEIVAVTKEKYSDGKQDYFDGLAVDYGNWWFSIRLSGTEPLLRLNIEADSQKLLEEKTKELSDFINNLSK